MWPPVTRFAVAYTVGLSAAVSLGLPPVPVLAVAAVLVAAGGGSGPDGVIE